jgi:predicted dehydrogenase
VKKSKTSSRSPLRLAVLGCGGTGAAHAQTAIAEGAVLTAACDRNLAKVEGFLAKLGSPDAIAYHSWAKLLAEADFDILAVCLPPGVHDGAEEEAARRGRHLFLEKPIALDSARAGSIAAAAESAGVATQVGFQYRWMAPVANLHGRIADGSAGGASLFTGRYWCNALHPAWWRDPALSGGQLFEQAIHLYDLALHFLGPATAISALQGNLCHQDRDDYRVEDTSGSVISFASGAIATIAASNCAIPGQWAASFSVVCRNLVGDFSSPDRGKLTITGGRPVEMLQAGETLPSEEPTGAEIPQRLMWRELLRAVREGTATRSPVRSGLDAVRLCEAGVRSARQGGARIALG